MTIPANIPFDKEQARRFLNVIMDPAVGCTEIRIFRATYERTWIVAENNYSKTLGGWYEDLNALVVDLGRLKGVSGFVTVNPVRRDLLARIYQEILKLDRDCATKDEDIVHLGGLYSDIDPHRPADISSTAEEFALAVAKRDEILASEPELAASSIWGRSGNGGWIWTKVPNYPNDAEHRDLTGRALAILAEKYGKKGRDPVCVDVSTKNPARVMVIPGTLKCKGANRPERPWRMATIDSPEDRGVEPGGRDLPPFDLKAWVAAQEVGMAANRADVAKPRAASQGTANGNGHRPGNGAAHGGPDDARMDARVLGYGHQALLDEAANVRNAAPGNRNNQLNASTLKLATLIESGALRPDEIAGAMAEAARSAGLDDREIRGTVESGMKAGSERSRSRADLESHLAAQGGGSHRIAGIYWPEGGEEPAGTKADDPAPSGMVGLEDNPHQLARSFIAAHYRHADGLSLRFWRDEFHAWDGTAYRPVPRKEVAAEVARSIEATFFRLYTEALTYFKMRQNFGKADGKGASQMPKPLAVTTRLVGDVTQALTDLSLLKVRDCPVQPSWVVPDPDWAAKDVLPTKNCLVHLPSLAKDVPATRPPTPNYFGSFAVDYHYSPKAAPPSEWLRFLVQLFGDDVESIETLQEWMGYLLTPDTSQQKVLMLIGPKRSGKGTIVRVIRALIGPDNVVNPTLSGLATHFGLAPLVGKPAAIITDARISGRTDTAVVIERILSISGEDSQTIDRKHRDVITTKLPTRFMLVSNELPKVKDASGALVGRMIFLQLTRSFYGREDTALFDRLQDELPAILNWAIEGWKRLNERGHFRQPRAAVDLLGAMEDLASPIKSFLREYCRLGSGEEYTVPTTDLYSKWRSWCQLKGLDYTGAEEDFGRNLRAAIPDLKKTHPRIDGKRTWCYRGLRFLEDHESNTNEEDEEFFSV